MKSVNLDNIPTTFDKCHYGRQDGSYLAKRLQRLNYKQHCGNHIFEIGVLLMVTNLMTAIYIWQSISSGWKITQGGDNFPLAFVLQKPEIFKPVGNQTDAYIGILRVIFSFLGNKEAIVLLFNFLFLLGGIAFFYRGSRRKIQSGGSLILTALAGIICVFSFDVNSDSSMVIIWAVLGAGFWLMCYLTDAISFFYGKSDALSWIFSFLVGGITGCFLYFDLSGLLLILSLLFFVLLPLEENSLINEEMGQKIGKFLAIISGAFLVFFLLASSVYTYDFTTEFFFNAWLNNRINFYFEATNFHQLLSVIIVYLVYWTLHIIYRKLHYIEAGAMNECKVACDLQESIQTQSIGREENQKISQDEAQNSNKEVLSLPGKGELEIKSKVQLLHNPLPGPRKHVKKVMDYAFEPTVDKMHYDLNNYNVNDDYDLK